MFYIDADSHTVQLENIFFPLLSLCISRLLQERRFSLASLVHSYSHIWLNYSSEFIIRLVSCFSVGWVFSKTISLSAWWSMPGQLAVAHLCLIYCVLLGWSSDWLFSWFVICGMISSLVHLLNIWTYHLLTFGLEVCEWNMISVSSSTIISRPQLPVNMSIECLPERNHCWACWFGDSFYK